MNKGINKHILLSIKKKHTTDTCKVNEPQKQPIELNKLNKTQTVFYLYEISRKTMVDWGQSWIGGN